MGQGSASKNYWEELVQRLFKGRQLARVYFVFCALSPLPFYCENKDKMGGYLASILDHTVTLRVAAYTKDGRAER